MFRGALPFPFWPSFQPSLDSGLHAPVLQLDLADEDELDSEDMLKEDVPYSEEVKVCDWNVMTD